MAETFLMRALGRVRTARTDLSDDYWGSVVSSIELDPDVVARDALQGLDAFGPGGDTTQPVWATALMTHYFDD